MKFLLIRHGVTDWNKLSRLQGREDIPLNEEGRLQAENAGRALKNLHIDTILTSPLSRAKDTAETVCAYTGGKVTVEPDLIERDFGDLSGQTPKDIFAPEENDTMEPLDRVSRRFLAVLERYAAEETVVAVSHGAAINAVLRTISHGKTGSGKIRLYNGGISILGYNGKTFSIIKENIPAENFPEEWDKIK